MIAFNKGIAYDAIRAEVLPGAANAAPADVVRAVRLMARKLRELEQGCSPTEPWNPFVKPPTNETKEEKRDRVKLALQVRFPDDPRNPPVWQAWAFVRQIA